MHTAVSIIVVLNKAVHPVQYMYIIIHRVNTYFAKKYMLGLVQDSSTTFAG